MMSSITDVSGKLGDYMLKGWVLTDQSCSTPGCSVPMMRSPSGRNSVTYFCANCDEDPDSLRSLKPSAIYPSDSENSISSSSRISRSSTPPTEVSSSLSSPTFAPPTDTEEIRRRREQSDAASSEIGKRLLKGWAMLGDECPNGRCYGVPLVRPPRSGGGISVRKECVACGNVYVTETDSVGRERLVLSDASQGHPRVSTISNPAISTFPQDQFKAADRNEISNISTSVSPSGDVLISSDTSTVGINLAPMRPRILETDESAVQSTATTVVALEASARALELTLHNLSGRLTFLSSGQTTLDPSSVTLTVGAISNVVQALSQVHQLLRSERQARVL